MKLQGTLPERVGLLHAVPVFDIFVLILIALLLGQSLVTQSGVEVELPISRYQVARSGDATVITITPGDPPVIWLERDKVTAVELSTKLSELRDASSTVPMVYIRSDKSVPAEYERKIAEAALSSGYRVYLLGKPLPKN